MFFKPFSYENNKRSEEISDKYIFMPLTSNSYKCKILEKKKRQEGTIVVRHLQLNFVDILDIKSQMYEKIFYFFNVKNNCCVKMMMMGN